MKILLSRTSLYCPLEGDGDCEKIVPDVEIRKRFNIQSCFSKKFGKWFCTIEINTLDDLREFKRRIDKELVLTEDWLTQAPEIEIYDDWRE